MKIKVQTSIILTLVIIVAAIAVTTALGLWSTESTKVPQKLKQTQYLGQYDPADIRGSYMFSEISALFNIPLEDLALAFGVEESVAKDFKCKDLETLFEGTPYEIGTGSVRMFTAYYIGLPYEAEEETYLTQQAATLLKEKGNMNEQ